jgi:hypothetical protein
LNGDPPKAPAKPEPFFFEEQIGDEHSPDRGAQNDDQFGGLHRDLQIAVFHEVSGDHSPEYHHDAYKIENMNAQTSESFLAGQPRTVTRFPPFPMLS